MEKLKLFWPAIRFRFNRTPESLNRLIDVLEQQSDRAFVRNMAKKWLDAFQEGIEDWDIRNPMTCVFLSMGSEEYTNAIERLLKLEE